MRILVKRICRKYGYPPDLHDEAVQTVLAQLRKELPSRTAQAPAAFKAAAKFAFSEIASVPKSVRAGPMLLPPEVKTNACRSAQGADTAKTGSPLEGTACDIASSGPIDAAEKTSNPCAT